MPTLPRNEDIDHLKSDSKIPILALIIYIIKIKTEHKLNRKGDNIHNYKKLLSQEIYITGGDSQNNNIYNIKTKVTKQ